MSFLDLSHKFGLVPKTGFSGPWSHVRQASLEADPKTFKFDAKGFTALVDCHMFEPAEVSVRTMNSQIIVECQHGLKEDGHGEVERHFVRRFSLPHDYDMTAVKSTLSKDGILHLEVPKPIQVGEEKHITIEHSEKPSFLMSLLSNRANSMLRRSHSIPSDNEED